MTSIWVLAYKNRYKYSKSVYQSSIYIPIKYILVAILILQFICFKKNPKPCFFFTLWGWEESLWNWINHYLWFMTPFIIIIIDPWMACFHLLIFNNIISAHKNTIQN